MVISYTKKESNGGIHYRNSDNTYCSFTPEQLKHCNTLREANRFLINKGYRRTWK